MARIGSGTVPQQRRRRGGRDGDRPVEFIILGFPGNKFNGELGGLISEEDIEYAAEALDPNSSAALLIWEDVWAKPFVEALRNPAPS